MRLESFCGEVRRGLERKGRRGEARKGRGKDISRGSEEESGVGGRGGGRLIVLTRVGTRACITSRLDESIRLINQK